MSDDLVIVALSGGVDSAVAALLLREAGHAVQCLHMSNWEDDGYCDAARDYQDARAVCRRLGLPLHRVNFAAEYRAQVFEHFLAEHRRGRTPNPDVLCNREIKFGVLWRYAKRLGATRLATGHYARTEVSGGGARLLKGLDPEKDQSYFLHAVSGADLEHVLFPLGEKLKSDVRTIAREADIPVASKKDSTGICFIGERPFAEFLSRYLPGQPGDIVDGDDGRVIGQHRGLAYYTLGQRHGLHIGGVAGRAEAPWYVAAKDFERNRLVVVQGADHPLLYQDWLEAEQPHWVNGPPAQLSAGKPLRVAAKTRYRQHDQACTVRPAATGRLEVSFDRPQRAISPGQYVVFYQNDVCLGGAVIRRAERREGSMRAAG
jgi:tRNA-uridine 2-sulfurtransferase